MPLVNRGKQSQLGIKNMYKKKQLMWLTSKWHRRAKAHSRIQDQDHCISFLVMPAALTDSAALLSATSPSEHTGQCDRYMPERQQKERIRFWYTMPQWLVSTKKTWSTDWPVRESGERGRILLSCERPRQVLLCVAGPTSSLFALSRRQKCKMSKTWV